MKTLIISILLTYGLSVHAQVIMTLPGTLANVTHDYSNADVTAAIEPTNLNSVRLTARDINYTSATINLNNSRVKGNTITFTNAAGVVNLNNTPLQADRVMFNSDTINLNNSNITASRIAFTGNVYLQVQGDIKIVCNDLEDNLGNMVTITAHENGGSLIIEYKGNFRRESFSVVGNINVSFVKR
jgi:hypothetical protein